MALYLTEQQLTDRGITTDATKATILAADIESRAVLLAPCLANPDQLTELQRSAVVAILADIAERKQSGAAGGATTTTKTAGSYSESYTVSTDATTSNTLFRPSEIADLQGICDTLNGQQRATGAFSIELAPTPGPGARGGYRRGVYGRPNSPVTWGQ